MAHGPLAKLDEEQRQLHDSGKAIARLIAFTLLIAVIVWAATNALRWTVHHSAEALMHQVEHGSPLLGATVLLTVLGLVGALRGWLLRRPGWEDAAGDGLNVALDNFHSTYDHLPDDPQPRYARPDLGLAGKKGIATLLTLGSGGSGGLEAPVVLISESLAAGVARLVGEPSEHALRTYQLAAISAAVATLLGAPFTAALFATEIAYGDRIIYRKLAYALMAGLVATSLNLWTFGDHPLFFAPARSGLYSPAEYGATALVAIAVSAPVALGFGVVMTRTRQDVLARVAPAWRGAASALAVGLIALALWWVADMEPHHVLGMGEETLVGVLAGDPTLGVWWFLALALLGKMLTTGLTLQGGGSAGLLIPSMYLGGVSGALTAEALGALGLGGFDPALCAVAGIASALVAVVGVPLAAIALVLELFGRVYGPAAILACGVTYLIALRIRVYRAQRLSPTPSEDEIG